ncbi:MAG TPA: hypothetical protein VK603_07645 [Candidatus Saccharimonadales bacterium]|nr:hypothetical protein [Candidatus Saccharimonadales bacterium]
MKEFTLLMGLLLLPAMAQALTVDEIVKLKRAGVADSTIELLVEKDAVQQKRSGIVRQNGWIVHTTDTREAQPLSGENYEAYPIQVYPQVGGVRRR